MLTSEAITVCCSGPIGQVEAIGHGGAGSCRVIVLDAAGLGMRDVYRADVRGIVSRGGRRWSGVICAILQMRQQKSAACSLQLMLRMLVDTLQHDRAETHRVCGVSGYYDADLT